MVYEILAEALKQTGIGFLQPYQYLCIYHILKTAGFFEEIDNNSAEEHSRRLIVLPTGYGKTLCFTLPALVLPHPSLVIYPLKALMADQQRRFESMNIPSVVLEGGLSPTERRARIEAIKAGKVRIVIANPEILLTETVREEIQRISFSHIVLDEAHVIEQWGKSFRPAYLELGNLLACLKTDQITALTATANPEVLQGIRSFLGDSAFYHLAAPIDRPEIAYRVLTSARMELTLNALLKGTKECMPVQRPCIIFVRNRASCEWLALHLSHSKGIGTIRFYHAGLSSSEKHHIEHWFYHSNDGILVSTNAYGMGVDKNNIRTVIHAGLPDSAAAYLQESGRAGRDKKPAEVIALHRVAQYTDVTEYSGEEFPGSFLNSSLCRRNTLLRLMGCDAVECSGCDVCNGTVSLLPPEVIELKTFLSRHRRILQRADFPIELQKSGALQGFSLNQIRQVLHDCINSKLARYSKSPLSWKSLTT